MRPGKDRPRPPFIASSNQASSQQVRVRENNKHHDLEIFKNRVFLVFTASMSGSRVRGDNLHCNDKTQCDSPSLFKIIFSKFKKIILEEHEIFLGSISSQSMFTCFTESSLFLTASNVQCPLPTYRDNSRLVHLITLLAFKVSAICDPGKYKALIAEPSHHLNVVQPG